MISRLERYAAAKGILSIPSGVTRVRVRLIAGGGGGAATSNVHFIPPSQYGKRGEDTIFGLHPPEMAMHACPPNTPLQVYHSGNPGFEPGHAVVYLEIPPEVTGLAIDTPYYPINISETAPGSGVWTWQLSATPYSPPFGGQVPIICGPAFTNPSYTYYKTWFGVQGGGGGGIIGDQGTPLSYWGLDGIGPNGVVQSEGYQGGAGLGYFRIGPPGGVNAMGGNSGSAYQDFGINGTNLCGAGGGGAPPPVGTTAPGEWSGCSGASGSWGDVEFTPVEGFIPWFFAGNGGDGGPAGTNGYPGGKGGHGMVRFWFDTIVEAAEAA